MKRILIIIILATLTVANFAQVGYSRSVFKDSAGVNVPINFKDFKFSGDVFFKTPISQGSIDTTQIVSKTFATNQLQVKIPNLADTSTYAKEWDIIFIDSSNINVPVNYRPFNFGQKVSLNKAPLTEQLNVGGNILMFTQAAGEVVYKMQYGTSGRVRRALSVPYYNDRMTISGTDGWAAIKSKITLWDNGQTDIYADSSKPIKFYQNTNEIASFDAIGNLAIDGTLNSYPIRQGIALSDTTKFLLLADTTALHFTKLAAKFNTADTTAFNSKTLTTAQLSYKADTSSVLWKDSSGVLIPKVYSPIKIGGTINGGNIMFKDSSFFTVPLTTNATRLHRLFVSGGNVSFGSHPNVLSMIGTGELAKIDLTLPNTVTTAYGLHMAGVLKATSNLDATTGMAVTPILTSDEARTITNNYGLRVLNMVKGADVTVTNNYGLYLDAQTTGGTNYSLYNAGTTQLSGAVAINGYFEATVPLNIRSFARSRYINKIISSTNKVLMSFYEGSTGDGQIGFWGDAGAETIQILTGTGQIYTAGGLYLGTKSGSSIIPIDSVKLSSDAINIHSGANYYKALKSTGGNVIVYDSLNIQAEASKIDSATIISLEAGKAGWGEVMIGDAQEWATFHFTSAGVVTLRTNSTNVGTTPFDAGKLNIYDAGTGVAIQNYLSAGQLKVAINVKYYTP